MDIGRWTLASLLLIVVGIVMLAINALVFAPRFVALRDATLAWSKNGTEIPPPNPSSFGIDTSTYYIAAILGIGYLLVFIGASYLVIILVSKIAKKQSCIQ